MGFPGHILKSKREELGFTEEQIMREHNVPSEVVKAFDGGNIHALPTPIFATGFLRTYCLALDIEPESMITELQVAFAKISADASKISASRTVRREWKLSIPQFSLSAPPEVMAWVSITALIAFGWFAYSTFDPFDAVPTEASMVDTRSVSNDLPTRVPNPFGLNE